MMGATMGRTSTIMAKPSRKVPSAINASNTISNSITGPKSYPAKADASVSGIWVSAGMGKRLRHR